MGAPGRLARGIVVCACLGLALSQVATAAERAMRRLGPRDGLTSSAVLHLAQDARGFLWIATEGGLHRYDGHRIVRWGESVLRSAPVQVAAGGGGRVLVLSRTGHILAVQDDTLVGISIPPGAPVRTLAVTRDGTGFAADDEGALWRLPSGAVGWDRVNAGRFQGEAVRRLQQEGGEVHAITRGGVWRLSGGSPPRRIVALEGVLDVTTAADGALHVVRANEHAILTLDGGRVAATPIPTPPTRFIDVAWRKGAVWAAFDLFLVRVGPDGRVDVMDRSDGLPSGGPLLVDRDGGLWIGTLEGPILLPEPDTRIYGVGDGLPSDHTRFLARSGDGVWVSTWQGLGRISESRSDTRVESLGLAALGQICVDGRGAVWTGAWGAEDEVVVWSGAAGAPPRTFSASGTVRTCTVAPDGSVLLATPNELLRGAPGGESLQRIVELPRHLPRGARLHHDRSGTLWAGDLTALCRLGAGRWDCQTIPFGTEIRDMIDGPQGALWIATDDGGVLRRDPEGAFADALPGIELGSHSILGLSPSPRGGVWISGHGTLMRVGEVGGRLRLLERPSFWNGVDLAEGQDVLEEADGTVWVTTSSGVLRMPPSSRREPTEAPPVWFVEASMDGTALPPGRSAVLPWAKNRIELSFAAPAFRDSARLRYRLRVRDGSPWVETRDPTFRFVDLAPGRYRASVVASLDGAAWSPVPATFGFEVLPPWYRRWWAWALYALALIAMVALVYRVRLQYLLGLERQRTRIAMDLHDELGSGLGSIGILAGVSADADLPAGERRSLAETIAETAGELGASLSDIVWSLRQEAETLPALAAHLTERARRIVPGPRPRLELRIPRDLPPARLALAARRNAQRIAFEALHNAARHAAAERIVLGIETRGRQVVLTVEDDGRGEDPASVPSTTGGLGLESMRTRAAEIGGRLDWDRTAEGTRVVLSFDPGAARPRFGRRRAHRR